MPLTLRNLTPQDLSNGALTLWKYLTFEKFLDFLLMKRLYFRRVDKLTDPFECLMPPDPDDGTAGRTPAEAAELLARHQAYVERERAKVFVSSWHVSEHESEAMWKLFGGPGHSIAITARLDALMAHLAGHDLTVGKVLYKDAITPDLALNDVFDFAFLKRQPFEHEKEFRLVYLNGLGPDNPVLLDANGLHVAVEPSAILQHIYVSPLSEPWQVELTQRIVEREGLADKVITSTLFGPVRPEPPRRKKSR